MSDDERMDRAERIKQLRQGRRDGGSDDRTDDAPSDGTEGDSTQSSEEQTGDGAVDPERDDDQTGSDQTTDDGGSTADEEPTADGTMDGTESGQSAVETSEDGDSDSGGSDTADADSGGSDDSEVSAEDDDSISAAQAAAEAAAEFEGENASRIDAAGKETDETDPEAAESAAPAGASIADTGVEETTDEETRVLEFRLGEEYYCLDIEYVEEIVREETITRVPNTPEYVEGVVDLRGQITTILDPKVAADIEAENDEQLLIVFDAETLDDHGEIGWLVDAVDQVSLIAESDVKEPPMDETGVNGVIERGEEFVIWTTPELALDVTEAE